jgi:hypothetical protein
LAKAVAKAKQEQMAAQRAEHKRRVQRAKIIRWSIAGLAAVALAGAAGMCVIRDRALTEAVTTASYPGGQHTTSSVTYRETPPVGGLHNAVWQNCGIYSTPIHNEHGVHSLEHGAVWITYQPGLPADQVQRLRELASDDYMLLSPYPGLPAPVVASSWNYQIRVERADDPRLPQFISRYKNNPSTTPEFGAVCFGGVSTTAERPLSGAAPGPMR